MFLSSSRSFFKPHRFLGTVTTRHATTLIVGGDAAVPNAVTAARARDPEATLELILTSKDGAVPTGISKVWYTETHLAETMAAAVAQVAKNNTAINCIMGTSTKWGSTVVPRIGALLDASPVTDIIAVESAHTYVRPLYAGNALVRVTTKGKEDTKPLLQVLSVRPTAFEAAETASAASDMEMEHVPVTFDKSEWVGADTGDTAGAVARPDLGQAKIVVSGGRGLNHQFTVIEELADTLGAAVGASRAAVDAGMAPNNLQVGQTGTVVAPNLYIAVGISGAIQHISGMKDSKTVVAINKDPEAPIFQIADYGLAADLFEAVPEMNDKLKQ